MRHDTLAKLRIGGSLLIIAVAIALVLFLAPLDRVLGKVSRLVYLHGAMVWVALIGYTAAGVLGVLHLATEQPVWYRWSQGAERAAILFWAGYLPLSVIAADLAWNGVFWGEPRWAMAAEILLVAVGFQIGGALLGRALISSTLNAMMAGVTWWLLLRTPLIIHPDNPIGTSDSVGIKLSFVALVGLCGAAALLIARELRPALPGEPQESRQRPLVTDE